MTTEVDFDVSEFQRALVVFDQELDRRAKSSLHFVIDRAVNEAKSAAPASVSGALANSIQRGETSGELSSGNLESSFAAGVKYASYVEEGTEPHEIKPKFRRALRFPIRGAIGSGAGFAFRRKVNHPGTQAHPFMGPAKERAEAALEKQLDAAVTLAARKAGLK